MLRINKTHIPILALIFLFSLVTYSYFSSASNAYGQKSMKGKIVNAKDSLPPSYLIRIPVIELQKSMDSLNIVVSYVGKSLSVDQSDEVKRLYARVMNTLLRNVTLDSTTIAKPKK